MKRFPTSLTIGTLKLLLLLLICTGCEQNEKIKRLDKHIYLRDWGGYYHHDPDCPECQKNRIQIELDKTK